MTTGRVGVKPLEKGLRRALYQIAVIAVLVLTFSVAPASAEEPADETACKFTLEKDERIKPMISGPQEFVSLAYLVSQPDSPVEIIAIDFAGSFLSFSPGRESERHDVTYSWGPRSCRLKLRNRSDRFIKDLELTVQLRHRWGGGGTGGHLAGVVKSGLAPGQETTYLQFCGGHGHGTAQKEELRLALQVEWVDFEGCRYYPSKQVPHNEESALAGLD